MNLIKLSALSIFSLCSSSIMNAQPKTYSYPSTKWTDYSDTYFGQKIADPYHWLENDTSQETAEWVNEENKFTHNYLTQIPFREKLKSQLKEQWNFPKRGVPTVEGKYKIMSYNSGLENQAELVITNTNQGAGTFETLLNPNTMSKDGTVALQAYSFSKNQKYFAYSISASGSDWQEIYIIDPSTKKPVDDVIKYVKFTGLSWNGDDGFYYSGYEKPQNESLKYSVKTEYQKVFYHKIGTKPSTDKVIYEDKNHPLRYVEAGLTEDNHFLILSISEGTDGTEIRAKDLTKTKSDFQTIVKGFSTNAAVIDNDNNYILLQTNKNAPNYKVVAIDFNNLNATEKIIVPESDHKLEAVTTAGGYLFAQYLENATSKVEQYRYTGEKIREVKLPGIGTISGFSSHKSENSVYYAFTSFTMPAYIYRFDLLTGESTLDWKTKLTFNPDEFETIQVFYPSKDGTQIPMFITKKKSVKLDGTNPTLLYAYGGFNISLTPTYSPSNMVFIQNGGIYCLANIRGGGENGENWHKAGMLANKQNVFDDFIAAGEYLIKEKYTDQKHLAIRGGSNGGLLIGACITQRPDLFAVAFPQVGVMDMLRFQKFTVGWGWVSEYGSSDKKDQFNYLRKYSPLHNIKSGTCYPATMVTTADHDDRVVPAHSFKFAATLQKAQSCDKPVLIRIDAKAGHGAGKPTDKKIEEEADIWSFLFYNMNIQP